MWQQWNSQHSRDGRMCFCYSTGASQHGGNAEDVQSPQVSCMCLRRCFVRYKSDQDQLRKQLLMVGTLSFTRGSVDLINGTEASVVQRTSLEGRSEVLSADTNTTTRGSVKNEPNWLISACIIPHPEVKGTAMASTLLLGKAEDQKTLLCAWPSGSWVIILKLKFSTMNGPAPPLMKAELTESSFLRFTNILTKQPHCSHPSAAQLRVTPSYSLYAVRRQLQGGTRDGLTATVKTWAGTAKNLHCRMWAVSCWIMLSVEQKTMQLLLLGQ